jgi:hypothetical protein
MMNNGKYSSLLDRAKELREAAIANATKQVLEETAPEHRKLIYEKLNRNAAKKLNENIYEDEEESALDKLLAGDEASIATPGTLGAEQNFAAPPDGAIATSATVPTDGTAPTPVSVDTTNDVSVDTLDIDSEVGAEDGEESDQEKIDPKDVLELTDEDLKDLDADKLRELFGVLMTAYQNEEITVPEGDDGEISLEIPETGEEIQQDDGEQAGLVGDQSGEVDSLLAGGGQEEYDTDTESELDKILSGSSEDEDEQELGLSLESRLIKRQKQLKETVRNKRNIIREDVDTDEKILLQDEEELEEENNSLKEEENIMNSKLTNLKDKLRRDINREKRTLTGGRREKTLNESRKQNLQERTSGERRSAPTTRKLEEQVEILRHERDIYSRRLKDARRTLRERDEKLNKIENELEDVTNYTLRYSTLQKLFTNNPIVRQMNESQKEEVIDIIDSVKGLPKDEAKRKLDEIYREFQEETSMLSESRRPTRQSQPLNEGRKRPATRRGDVKPVLGSTRNKKEEQNIFESVEIKRMLEIADINNNESDD